MNFNISIKPKKKRLVADQKKIAIEVLKAVDAEILGWSAPSKANNIASQLKALCFTTTGKHFFLYPGIHNSACRIYAATEEESNEFLAKYGINEA